MMDTIIFDLDGTLADISARRVFLTKPKKNWKEFNARMASDLPNKPIVQLYLALWAMGTFDIILVSGRSAEFRAVTENWLNQHKIPFKALYMRPAKDNRADHIVKQEILDQLRSEGRQILFTVDDRQQVVDMWRRNGITCLQCDVGDF